MIHLKPNKSPVQKTVLITGGSSGIGFAMSRKWANAGYHILWVALNESELSRSSAILKKEFPEVRVDYVEMDLSTPGNPQNLFEWVSSVAGTPSVLINNAGFATYGYTYEISIENDRKMLALNIEAFYVITRLFLSEFFKNNSGTIINICSNSAFQPVPRMNTYASTKAFVYHFSKGLEEELQILNSSVRVITVCPSAVKDSSFKNSGQLNHARTFEGLAATTCSEVADDVWKGFCGNTKEIITGSRMRLFHAIRWLVPYRLQQFLVNKETEILTK